MKAIIQIGRDVVLEARRNQVFLLTLFSGLLLVFVFGVVFSTNESLKGKIFLETGITVIWFIHFCLAIFFTTESMFTDISGKSIYYYLVRDVSRLQYVLGKFVGFCSAVGLSVLVSGLLLFLGCAVFGNGLQWQAVQGIIFLLCELSLCVAVLMFLCFIFTKLISTFLFIFIFFFTSVLEYFITTDSAPVIIKWILALLPNFKYYSYLDMVVHAKEVSGTYISFLLVYTMFFCALLLVGSTIQFLKKQL
jgi:ABC-type transport system involved in multi-copper enzyme maturation permease subunit